MDIYALRSVLYEMLAGTTAFTGPSAQAIIVRAMTTDPQPIHPIRTAVTPALDTVILKAMSRTPADRFAKVDAFANAVAVVVALAVTFVMKGAGADAPRLAVLPFDNRSSASSDAYLAEGFTEEIGNSIARVRNVIVLSNNAVRRVEVDSSMSLDDIGIRPGATFLMSGSVQRIGGRLRVSVELARASGERVWSNKFDRAQSELPKL